MDSGILCIVLWHAHEGAFFLFHTLHCYSCLSVEEAMFCVLLCQCQYLQSKVIFLLTQNWFWLFVHTLCWWQKVSNKFISWSICLFAFEYGNVRNVRPFQAFNVIKCFRNDYFSSTNHSTCHSCQTEIILGHWNP